MKRFAMLLVLAGVLLSGGCLPAPATESALPPTATFTPLPSPTATVVWFPPTATPTPLPPTPIPTPTPDLLAGLGAPLAPNALESAAAWRSPSGFAGRFGVSAGALTLTVTRPRATMLVLLNDATAYNFYMAVETQPQVCRGNDAYGIVLRSTSGAGRYYRFGLTCQGEAFVELVEGQVPVAKVRPQPAGVPAGALVRSRLSVRAEGKMLHFAVNGQVLFTLRDDLPAYERNHVGFFARATGEEGVIVRFHGLVLREGE